MGLHLTLRDKLQQLNAIQNRRRGLATVENSAYGADEYFKWAIQ